MERIKRREFLKISAASAAGLFIPDSLPVRTTRIADIAGIVEGTLAGGSQDLNLAFYDITMLGIGPITALNPSEVLHKEAARLGHSLITRVWRYPEDNRFHQESLESEIIKAKKYSPTPNVQPANEVNMNWIVGVRRPAREYIREDFIPQAELIHFHGGRPLLPPLAQNSDPYFNEETYLYEEIDELTRLKGVNWFKTHNIAIASHPYILMPGDDPLQIVRRANQIIRNRIGITLPILVTESGLYQNAKRVFPEETVASETLRILSTPIPSDLKIETYCFWVLSNFAQRPTSHRMEEGVQGEQLWGFEASAWRGFDKIKLVYYLVSAYMNKHRIIRAA